MKTTRQAQLITPNVKNGCQLHFSDLLSVEEVTRLLKAARGGREVLAKAHSGPMITVKSINRPLTDKRRLFDAFVQEQGVRK